MGPCPKGFPPSSTLTTPIILNAFLPFTFPFSLLIHLIFSLLLTNLTSPHALEVYHNEQDKEIEKVKKEREKIVVSGIELKKGIMK